MLIDFSIDLVLSGSKTNVWEKGSQGKVPSSSVVWRGHIFGFTVRGLWFEGPPIFPDFALLCQKQNGATIHLNVLSSEYRLVTKNTPLSPLFNLMASTTFKQCHFF